MNKPSPSKLVFTQSGRVPPATHYKSDLFIWGATPEARAWIEAEAPQFGQFTPAGEFNAPRAGGYALDVSPAFNITEVAQYLESYGQTAAPEEPQPTVRISAQEMFKGHSMSVNMVRVWWADEAAHEFVLAHVAKWGVIKRPRSTYYAQFTRWAIPKATDDDDAGDKHYVIFDVNPCYSVDLIVAFLNAAGLNTPGRQQGLSYEMGNEPTLKHSTP